MTIIGHDCTITDLLSIHAPISTHWVLYGLFTLYQFLNPDLTLVKSVQQKNIFLYFSTKTYVVGT